MKIQQVTKLTRGILPVPGDSYLRNILVEGAWASIRKDADLNRFYQQVYSRHPKNIAARKAIVAVARKLTTRIFAVLTERRVYTPEYKGYNNKPDKKRKPIAPKDASTLRRTTKYVLKRTESSPVLIGSTCEKETSGHFYAQRDVS